MISSWYLRWVTEDADIHVLSPSYWKYVFTAYNTSEYR